MVGNDHVVDSTAKDLTANNPLSTKRYSAFSLSQSFTFHQLINERSKLPGLAMNPQSWIFNPQSSGFDISVICL